MNRFRCRAAASSSPSRTPRTISRSFPRAEQDIEEWQAAVEALLLVVELSGPTMMARIGMLRAHNRHVERVFNPSRKDTNWGKRKLKTDE
jgi:cob(I)alamin adenosyltransferase